VHQAELDSGGRPGRTSEEAAEVKALKKEITVLRRADEILKTASDFLASMPSCGLPSS
jgi:transposase